MTTHTWTTTPLARTPKALHHIAHYTQPGDDDTIRALCNPYLVLHDTCTPPKRHGKCIGCLTATAENPGWCVTDLQILRELADPWILAGLITDPTSTAKHIQKQRPGSRNHGTGYAWARDGIRIWRNKQPGAAVIDDHTPDRVVTWTDLTAHAKQHSTTEQAWWLTELDAWTRHWWERGLDTHQTGDKETGWAHGRRQQAAQNYAHAIAYPTWTDTTLAPTPPAPTPAAPTPAAPVQLDLLDLLETP